MTSDASFPFGGPDADQAPGDDAGTGGSRRTALVAGVLGLALLGGGGIFLLGGGGGEEDTVVAVPKARPVAAAPEAAAPAPIEVVPAASTQQLGRNPFKPRYVEPKEAPKPVETPSPAAPPTPASIPLPPQPVQIVVQQPAEEQAPAEYPITFVSTSEQGGVKTYTWRLDGAKETLTVLQGQRFGKYGELIVLMTVQGDTGPEAVLQVGDSSPVTVKLEETIKVL